MVELIYLVDLLYRVAAMLILARVIVSWIPGMGMGHPAVQVLHQITSPILDPIRRLLPPVGGLDLSPIVAILLLSLVRTLLVELAMTMRL